MSYDESAAARIRQALPAKRHITERKMMGALCFMIDGHMCCGVTGAALMIRVGQENYQRTLARPHVRPMDIGGRQPKGFVLVDPEGYRSKAALDKWLVQALAFTAALEPKKVARQGKS